MGYTFGLKLSQSKLIQQKTQKNEFDLLRFFPVLLQNICLIHDIGNAPFGHFGETIISDYFNDLETTNEQFKELGDHQKRDFLNYDGNAQGLRVLTKLQYLDNPFGLNLTYATLGAYIKYPNYKKTHKEQESELKEKGEILEIKRIESSKHGVFFSEKDYFENIMNTCGLKIGDNQYLRHPLCYLMEAADSIAYLCMDMEDGFSVIKGLLDYYIKFIFHTNKKYINKAKSLISKSIIDCAIEENLIEICNEKIKKTIKKLEEEIEKFLINSPEYAEKLKKELEEELENQKKYIVEKDIYQDLFNKQTNKVLTKEELMNLRKSKNEIIKLISPDLIDLNDYYKFRVILDFISGMTDQYALNHYQKISGQKI